MPLPAAILAQMRDTVTIRLSTGVDAYNAKTYGDAFIVKGRVSYARTTVSNTGGDQVIHATLLYLPDVVGMTTDAEVTLPDGTKPDIKALHRLAWPDGAFHLRLVL